MNNNIATQVAEYLLEIKAVQLRPQEPFTWASGLKSPIYCDNRMVLSFPHVRKYIIDAFIEKVKAFESFNYVAGVATAGIPHAALIANQLDLPMIYIRSKIKDHGKQNLIEGNLREDSKVLVIEDLISTGGSSLSAVEAVKATGSQVVGVAAIFTYGFELAVNAFKSVDCPLITLTDYNTLLDIAQEKGVLTKKEMDSLKTWSASPKEWSNKMSQKLS